MNAIVEITPAVEAEAADVDKILAYATGFKVATASDYEKAGEALKRIKGKAKALDELRKSLTGPLDAAKKRIMEFFKAPADKLELAERAIKGQMVAFQEEQDRIRREAERKAAEAARKERERLEREAAAAAEKARKEREAAEAKIAAMEAAGRAEKAEAMRAAADEKEQVRQAEAFALQAAAQAMPVAPVVDIPRTSVAGTSIREEWRYEIVDPAMLPREYLIPDEKAIGAVVRALKDRASIPGVRAYSEKNISARSA